MAEVGSVCAAGLTVSFAPMTMDTSVSGKSSLISSIANTISYGIEASANKTFMWPGKRPATGWMPKRTSFPKDLNNFVNSHTECCARETAMPYPGTMITDLASMSVLTVSSLVKIVGSRSSTGAFGSFFALPPVSPNPPANTETNDRFIASAMTKDKMIPDAPTKAPPIIINSLSNMKPAKTPAHPDPEFNTDITTGISAPPIAMVNK